MGKYVKILLKGKNVNLYVDDPYDFCKGIDYDIELY